MMKEAIRQYEQTHSVEHFYPRCVLFDMDGVLYNSMPNHAVAWQEAMRQFGLHFTAADAYATEGARGVDTIRLYVRRQLNKDITIDEAQRIYDVKTSLFHDMKVAEIFPGVRNLMQQIKDAGMTIGVVTGSGQRPLIKRLLNDFGDFLTEDHIVTAYDVEHGKPAPDPYLMGLHKTGNNLPSQGIVVENAPLGVRAGVAAGCFTIGVNTGPLPDTALSNEGAHIVLPSIEVLGSRFKEIIG